jgi:predicted SnoaL-like aldol condensation-catalyzing enzyme
MQPDLIHHLAVASIEEIAMTEAEQANKALVIEAFDTLFNRRDYATAQRFWSPRYIQHSGHIKPGRDGLFDLVKTLPTELRYEHQLVVADGDYVMLHGRFSQIGQPANWVVADIVRVADGMLAEHWDIIQAKSPAPNPKAGYLCSATPFPPRWRRPTARPRPAC